MIYLLLKLIKSSSLDHRLTLKFHFYLSFNDIRLFFILFLNDKLPYHVQQILPLANLVRLILF